VLSAGRDLSQLPVNAHCGIVDVENPQGLHIENRTSPLPARKAGGKNQRLRRGWN